MAIAGMYLGCGCKTITQLRRWFTESEYKKLSSLGYQSVRMQVGRLLAESDIQLVFERACPLNEQIESIDLYYPGG
jgi:hypothetical protein